MSPIEKVIKEKKTNIKNQVKNGQTKARLSLIMR